MRKNLEQYEPVFEEPEKEDLGEEYRDEIIEVKEEKKEEEEEEKGGKVEEKQKEVKSKFEEDVYINGHTAIWGSFWSKEQGWGFKCCRSHDKEAKCPLI